MILLGILLIAVALGGGALLFVGASGLEDAITIPVLGGSINLPPVALFIAGAVAALLLWLGWAMVRGGARRSARQRRQAKENARIAEEQRRRGVDSTGDLRREDYGRVASERSATDDGIPQRGTTGDSVPRRGDAEDERGRGRS